MSVRILTMTLLVMSTVVGNAGAAKKTLRWWVPGDIVWKELAAKFEKSNPGVQIVVVNGTIDKFYTMVTAGMMPDIWGPWETPGITADVNRNWALDLTPYIKRDGKSMNIDDFFPGLMRQFRVKGKQYSLPMFYYTDWFYYDVTKYNKAGLASLPIDAKDKSWNWDKMVINAQKTVQYDSQGKVKQPGIETNRYIGNWRHIWGVDFYGESAYKTSVPQEIHINTPEFERALTKVWELTFKHKVQAPGWDSKSFTSKTTAQSLEDGWIIKLLMPVKNFKWALAPLPWGETNSGRTWPDGWRISRITKDKEIAWKFIKYLCSPEAMDYAVTSAKSTYRGTGVARRSVFRDTMAEDISKVNGMKSGDVLRIYEQADDVGFVKDQETICLNEDIFRTYINPILPDFWNNRLSPKATAVKMQQAADKAMPILFNRWLRNIKFTGADKAN